jgi:hypothetical protein
MYCVLACHVELKDGRNTKYLTGLGEQASSDLPLLKPYALGQEFRSCDGHGSKYKSQEYSAGT